MTLTRRDFVKGSLAAVSLAAFAPKLRAGTGANNTLVILQMIGGNDTLNTFIPYTDARYRAARPQLAIPDANILHVDGTMGFHPSMPGLRDLYTQRKLAVVPQVGFASLDRSHFRCEDVWMTASETPDAQPRGWIGRWADLNTADPHSPLADVGISNTTPRGIAASRVNPLCLTDLASFSLDPSLASVIRANYALPRNDATLDLIRQSSNAAFAAMDLLATIPPAAGGYPNTTLGRAFALIAQIIAGNVGANVFWVTIGGFDTHGRQAKVHADLLADVSSSLAAFQSDIEHRGIADRTLVLAWSEFGRRVAENASLGTDHGKAGSMMLLGTRVSGGQFYGDPYDLADLDDGDLKTRIDFRSVYATVLRDWLNSDPEPVLGGRYENLNLIARTATRRRAALP